LLPDEIGKIFSQTSLCVVAPQPFPVKDPASALSHNQDPQQTSRPHRGKEMNTDSFCAATMGRINSDGDLTRTRRTNIKRIPPERGARRPYSIPTSFASQAAHGQRTVLHSLDTRYTRDGLGLRGSRHGPGSTGSTVGLMGTAPEQGARGDRRPRGPTGRGGSSYDGTACSMSLRRPTCDCVRRTVVSQYVSLLGMPASDWGASEHWCCLRKGSGYDRRPQKGLRAEWTIW
jgi:hypothetical protein